MKNLSIFSIKGSVERSIALTPCKVTRSLAKKERREVESEGFKKLQTPVWTAEPYVRIEKQNIRRHRYHYNKAWCIVICAGGEETPIYFGSRAAILVCVATLLCQKAGNRLYRSVFKRPTGRVADEQLPWHDVVWLRRLYDVLFPDADDRFSTWYGKMQQNSCHEISQAKSLCNRLISEAQGPEECGIMLEGNGNQRYYCTNLLPENIEVPSELQDLIPFVEAA